MTTRSLNVKKKTKRIQIFGNYEIVYWTKDWFLLHVSHLDDPFPYFRFTLSPFFTTQNTKKRKERKRCVKKKHSRRGL